MIYVSHLDMNRYFIRLLKLSKLPIWYTEGFNKHPYLTFALPLSLGFESDYEVVDFRVNDDEISLDFIKESLQNVAVDGIEIFKVSEPVNKTTTIKMAEYNITFQGDINKDSLLKFLNKEEIIITKLTKKKKEKQIDISKMIFNKFFFEDNGKYVLNLTLSAGPIDNLNPVTVLENYEKITGVELPFFRVRRTNIIDEDGKEFI